MGKSRFTSILKSRWLPATEKSLDIVALEMATDIHRIATTLAPKATRNLVNSGRIERKGSGKYNIVFGGNGGGFSVPYAKRRHYENNKNPQTLRYLERAGDAVKRGSVVKYVKNAPISSLGSTALNSI